MKRWLPWTVAVLAIALVAGGALRAVKARKAHGGRQRATAKATVALLPTDVLRATMRDLAQTLPVSGTLRAVESAVVKAKVAGELNGLAVREGDAVKAGQVIARIDSTEYASRVRQAQEQADSAARPGRGAAAQLRQQQGAGRPGLHFQDRAGHLAVQPERGAGPRTARRWPAVEVARKALDDTVVRSPIDGQVARAWRSPASGSRSTPS